MITWLLEVMGKFGTEHEIRLTRRIGESEQDVEAFLTHVSSDIRTRVSRGLVFALSALQRFAVLTSFVPRVSLHT